MLIFIFYSGEKLNAYNSFDPQYLIQIFILRRPKRRLKLQYSFSGLLSNINPKFKYSDSQMPLPGILPTDFDTLLKPLTPAQRPQPARDEFPFFLQNDNNCL